MSNQTRQQHEGGGASCFSCTPEGYFARHHAAPVVNVNVNNVVLMSQPRNQYNLTTTSPACFKLYFFACPPSWHLQAKCQPVIGKWVASAKVVVCHAPRPSLDAYPHLHVWTCSSDTHQSITPNQKCAGPVRGSLDKQAVTDSRLHAQIRLHHRTDRNTRTVQHAQRSSFQ